MFPQVMRLSAAGVRDGRGLHAGVLVVDTATVAAVVAATVAVAAGLDRDALRPDVLAVDEEVHDVLAGLDLVGPGLDELVVQRDRRRGVGRAEGRRTDRDRLAVGVHVDGAGDADLTVVAQLAAVHRRRVGVRLLVVREHVALVGRQRDAAVGVAVHGVVAAGDVAVGRVVGAAGVVDRNGGGRDLGRVAGLVEVRSDPEVDLGGAVVERDAVLDERLLDLDLERPRVGTDGPVERVGVVRQDPGVVVRTADRQVDRLRPLDLLGRVVTTGAVAAAGLRDLADVAENVRTVVGVVEVARNRAVPLVLVDRAGGNLDGVLAGLEALVDTGLSDVLADVDLVGRRRSRAGHHGHARRQ